MSQWFLSGIRDIASVSLTYSLLLSIIYLLASSWFCFLNTFSFLEQWSSAECVIAPTHMQFFIPFFTSSSSSAWTTFDAEMPDTLQLLLIIIIKTFNFLFCLFFFSLFFSIFKQEVDHLYVRRLSYFRSPTQSFIHLLSILWHYFLS